jgi:hypothetical protein
MQVRPEGTARRPNPADECARADPLTDVNTDRREVAISALEAVAVVDVDLQPAARVPVPGDEDTA